MPHARRNDVAPDAVVERARLVQHARRHADATEGCAKEVVPDRRERRLQIHQNRRPLYGHLGCLHGRALDLPHIPED